MRGSPQGKWDGEHNEPHSARSKRLADAVAAFQLPGESKSKRVMFQPNDGDHFIVSGPADELQVDKK